MSRFPFVAMALVLLLAPPATAQRMDDTPRLAVMSAFPPEWEALQTGLEEAETQKINGVSFVIGKLEGRDVVLFLSGVSMVNAAMTTQLAIERFAIEGIVFSGIAGGVDPSLDIGDVVVPAQWGKYLEGVMARETDGAFAIPPWMETEFPGFGMIVPRAFGVTSGRADEPDMQFWFPVDAGMLEVARDVAEGVTLEDCAEECLSERPQIVVGGNGVSGPFFVDNAKFRDFAFETFDARVLDMESAAVAHVAWANEVPFIAFRALSDLAGGGDGENEMGTFMALAAGNSADVMRAFLAAME